MAINSRRTVARSWARGIFAFCWIVLAGFSGLYLFTLFTDPAALGGQAFQVSAMTGGAAPAGAPSTATAEAPAPAAPMQTEQDPLNAAEVASLKESLLGVSQQLAQLDARLKPIERFVGPVAALPPAASVTTSPPAPQAAPAEADVAAPAPPELVEEPVEEVVQEVDVAGAEVETPPEPEPEPQAAAVPAPAAAPPAEAAAPPVAVTDEPEADAAADAAPEAPGELTALDPVTLPPAANDGSTRYAIEIGSVKSRDDLRPLWRELLTKHAALVAGLQPRRVKAPDNTWRLIAGPFADAADAEGACTLFKKAERPCAATVYAGDSL
jgi:hypothetical protein